MTVVINGTSGITDVNGSAAAPAITGTDTDTGVFFGTNTVSLSTGGTERLRLDSSGNLGLGVTPSAWGGAGVGAFQISGYGSFAGSVGSVDIYNNAYYDGSAFKYISSNPATRYSQNTSGSSHAWYNAASGTAGNAITFTQAMTLDASGNLGVGNTSPSYRLDITAAASNNGVAAVRAGSGYTSYVSIAGNGTTPLSTSFDLIQDSTNAYIYQRANAPMVFGTNNTERARIDSSGNLLVGKTAINNTNTGITLDLGSTGVKVVNSASTSAADGFQMYSTGAGGYRFYVNFAGTIFATNTTISSLSDVRYKENIVDLDVGLNSIMALKPRKFDWKEGKGANIKNARGFIAQEFEQVFPDMIDEWRDEAPEGEAPYKSVRQDLIPVLVKAIQEQQAIITQLQADVAALKAKA